MTEHHPFRSAKAKEECLALWETVEKNSWSVKSESRFIETTYGKTFVRTSGPVNAPPVVLIHSMGTNSLSWSNNIKELSKEFRTYAVDTVDDYGLSIYITRLKRLHDCIKWLDELFNGLDLGEKINLIGHSYGGWLTSQYALHFQNRLDKIVLLAPAATVQPIRFQFYARQIFMLLPFRFFRDSFFHWTDPTAKENPNYKKVIDQMEISIKAYKPKTSIARPTVLNDEELKSIKCPALFLVGDNEKIYSPQKAMARLERLVPSIEKEIINNAGHGSILQSPQTNERIMNFLKRGK